MSTTIDERVVEMRFDNKQFEQNVQTSLSTIEKLKRSLNLTGAAKGLEDVNTAAQKCNMSPLTNAVETVRVRFSALEVMAITALQNITNSALAAGKNLVSAFTIDPIKSGFEEYETQINAVQTILANTSSKGTTLEQVNNALDELNHYADMTIYNFTEMTRNIGTFTAAGVDLDTSVAAIKGIANLAAVSGSTSQQASTAMYQLSQALAAGTVKLQDWNSVVNAGMGGQVFQDALKETARVHGIAIDEMIADEGSFRETLSKGWLTSDILTETLAKFTGDLNEDQLRTMGYTEEQIQSIIKMGQTANDAATKVKTFTQLFDTLKEAAQSGWTQSWEIIVGDFEEAKELLTEVSDTFSELINASAEARNNMLQDWKDLGGRTMLIESAKNVFEGLLSVATPIREAFREIFPPMTGKQLAEITEKVRDLTAKFKIGEETSKNLKNTFKGMFVVLDIVAQAFKAVAGGVADLIGFVLPAGNGILSLTGNFGEYLVKLDETVKKTDLFNVAIKKVVDFIKTGVTTATDILKRASEAAKEFGQFIKQKFNFPGFELFHSFLERVQARMSQVGDGVGKMKSGVITAFEMMGDALEKCKFLKVLEALWTAVRTIAGGIAEALGTMFGSLAEKLGNADFSGVLDFLNSIAIGGVAFSISKFLKSVAEPLEGLEGILKGVTGILDGVRGCFEAYQTNLKAGTLIKIGSAIALLAGSIVAISMIDSDKLSASLGAITVLFTDLLASMAIFNKISGSTGKVTKACTAMIAMAAAVSILAGAMKKISDLDWEEIAKGLTGIAGLSAVVVASAKIMSSGSGKLVKGATSLVIFAAAIKVLASVCKDLSALHWDELGRGLTGVGVLLGEVAIFLNVAKLSGKAMTTATGIVILAAAMKILASACEDFGGMQWDVIGRGLTSIGVLLAEIAVFANLTGNAKHVISTGVALVAIGAAMKIFASAVTDFGAMQWDVIGRGLTAMGGALAEVALAVNVMPKNMVSIGSGLVVVGAALEIIANVMGKFGDMQWDEIGRGLAVMGGALAELALGLNVMKGTLSGSAAMLVAATALAVLTPVLSILGAMSWVSIAKGLITIAGAFTVIGVAGAVLTPLVPIIIALAGAFTLIGVGVFGIGAGLLTAGTGLSALAVGFTALAAAGAAGATAIVASLTVIITGVAALIPAVVEKIGEGIVAFMQAIAAGAPSIIEAFTVILVSMVSALSTTVPVIVETVAEMLIEILKTISTHAPEIIQTAIDILLSILQGLSNNISKVVQTAIEIIVNFLAGITQKLPDVIQAGVDLIIAFIQGISNAIPQLINAGFQMIIDFINGLAQSIEENTPVLLSAIANLIIAIITGFATGLGDGVSTCMNAGINMMKGFIKGIKSTFGEIVDAAKGVVSGAVDAIKDFLDIHSPSRKTEKIGEYTGEGYVEGLEKYKDDAEDAGEDIGEAAYSGLLESIEDGGELVNDTLEKNNQETLAENRDYWDKLIRIVEECSEKKNILEINSVEESKNAAEETSSLHDTQVAEEEQYWTNLLETKKKGEDAEKYRSMAMVDFRKDVLSQTIEILKTYTDALQSSTETLMNDASLFKDATSSADLTKNLKDQIAQIEEYGNIMQSLNSKIADGGLKEAINQMGVDSLDELKIINGMTDEELNNYVSLYDQKYALCQQAAAQQLTSLQTETETKLSALYGGAEVNLQQFAQSFDGTFESIRGYVGESVKIGSQLASGVAEGIIAGTEESKKAATQMITDIEEAAKQAADINSPSGLFRDQVGKFITEGVADGMVAEDAKSQVKASAEEVNNFVLESFAESKEKFVQAGTELIDGYREGISDSTDALTGQCTESMSSALSKMQIAIVNSKPKFQSDASGIMTSVISGINSQHTNAQTAFANIISGCLKTIDNNQSKYNAAGANLMIKLIAGVRSKDSEIRSAFMNILGGCLTSIANQYYKFQNAGQQCMASLISGVESKTSEAEYAFTTIISSILSVVREQHNRFYQAGSYLVDGFADGISDNSYKAEAKARAMARAAAEAAEDELDEHSPSKVGYHIGDYFGMAFVNAISDYTDKAYNAGASMAGAARTGLNNTVSKIRDAIDSGIDTQPTIRPVLDLSDVEAKGRRLDILFSRTHALSINADMKASKELELQNEGSNLSGGNSYHFTQNNYSPKPLSRIEIYRQTKNQFSAMERMVEA